MIVWLNGTWGAGKSTLAYELARRLPRAFVYDPENIGYLLRKNLPPSMHQANFQDHPEWRTWNLALLSKVARQYPGVILVPMTVIDPRIYTELIKPLYALTPTVHIILTASRTTILHHLRFRLHRDSFARQHLDEALAALNGPIPGTHVVIDGRSVDENVAAVAAAAGLTLLPDHRSKVRKQTDRIGTLLAMIRH